MHIRTWICSIVIVGLVACRPHRNPATSFDASRIPPGEQWHCFEVEYGGGRPSRTTCLRSEAECARQRHEQGALEECRPQPQAHCYSVTAAFGPETHCSVTATECQAEADLHAYEHTPSECGLVATSSR
jgi:hypothetical protein